jgi:cytochrome c-type biogenesis protein CcmH/NrfF
MQNSPFTHTMCHRRGAQPLVKKVLVTYAHAMRASTYLICSTTLLWFSPVWLLLVVRSATVLRIRRCKFRRRGICA